MGTLGNQDLRAKMENEIIDILNDLFKLRQIFHNEDDFRLALYLRILARRPRQNVFIEKEYNGKWVDIVIGDDEKNFFGIELKYKTRATNIDDGYQIFRLKNQTNYAFKKDIDWLSNNTGAGKIFHSSIVVFLSNRCSVWRSVNGNENCWNGNPNLFGNWINIDLPKVIMDLNQGNNYLQFRCFYKIIT